MTSSSRLGKQMQGPKQLSGRHLLCTSSCLLMHVLPKNTPGSTNPKAEPCQHLSSRRHAICNGESISFQPDFGLTDIPAVKGVCSRQTFNKQTLSKARACARTNAFTHMQTNAERNRDQNVQLKFAGTPSCTCQTQEREREATRSMAGR